MKEKVNKEDGPKVLEVGLAKPVRINNLHESELRSVKFELVLKPDGVVVKTKDSDIFVPNANITFIRIKK